MGDSESPAKAAKASYVGDETMNLLQTALPELPSPLRGYVDSEEDEVFFGKVSSKEKSTSNYKYVKDQRRTLMVDTAEWRADPDAFARGKRNLLTVNEEEDKENAPLRPPTPSPRKVNGPPPPTPKTRTKLALTPSSNEADRSASKLLAHLPKKPDGEIEIDEPDEGDASRVDVNNDQIFDDSIFTEYGGSEIDAMSSKISKTWERQRRAERRKSGNFAEPKDICDLVVEIEEASSEETADLSRRESAASTCSDWFDTTRDEMILYEKFGEDYDVVVEKMSREEKLRLREEVAKATPKDAKELLGDCSNLTTDDEGGDASKASDATDEACAATDTDVSDSTLELEVVEESLSTTATSSIVVPRTSEHEMEESIFEPPLPVGNPTTSLPNLCPWAASKSGASCKTMPSYLRPTMASRLKASPSKASDAALFSPPSSACKLTAARRAIGNRGLIDLKSVMSPVSQYIRSNPVPPILRSVRPKASRFLEEAEETKLDDELDASARPTPTKCYAPLPEVRYVPSSVALEQKLEPVVQHKELPKAFGTVNEVQAVVVRHVGRMRVPKGVTESDLVDCSPSERSPGGAATLKRIPARESMMRESSLHDESTMEMSIREVKEIKKPTTNFNK